MQTYQAELHVHTVLSPCAEVELIPPLIVVEAVERGINLIAITDHNASANVKAVQKAAQNSGLTVLPGMELQTQEEVHVLCLFDHLEQLNAWQEKVNQNLPPLQNKPDYFGEQFVVDETGEFIRRENQLLLTSASLSIEETFQEVRKLGGLAIPAHVDRKAFGLIENLGFVPPDLAVDALEVSRHLSTDQACLKFPQLKGYPLIQGGDVHRLEEFLGVNQFLMEAPTIKEIHKAFRDEGGRGMKIKKPVAVQQS
jgi:predicted metal-dependent phosphoesterase TrpH